MPHPPAGIASRIAAVRARADDAARAAGRDPREVRVLLATKTQDAATILEAVAAAVGLSGWGPVLVGENRVQELTAKAPALAPLVAAGDVQVHLIGHLQSNKVNPALATTSCVESVDSLAIAAALSTRCERDDRVLDVMVQVNVSGEASKSGVEPSEAARLAAHVAALPGLRLTGFMTIGARSAPAWVPTGTRSEASRPAGWGDDVVRAGYARLRAIRDEVLGSGAPGTDRAHELSMGMTQDLELGIAEGATIVRVGTGVFGPR